MSDLVFNGIGVFGAILALIAFYLLENEKLKSHDIPYLILNLTAGLFILISILHSWNLPAFVIEVAWIIISIYGLYVACKKKLASTGILKNNSKSNSDN